MHVLVGALTGLEIDVREKNSVTQCVSKHQGQTELIQKHLKITHNVIPAFLSDSCVTLPKTVGSCFPNCGA